MTAYDKLVEHQATCVLCKDMPAGEIDTDCTEGAILLDILQDTEVV